MAKRIIEHTPELNSLGRKLCLLVAALALVTFAYTANAAELLTMTSAYYSTPADTNIRKGAQLFKSPLPKAQEGATVNNKWDPKFKTNRYIAHHVYYEKCTCWLNIAVARAKELSGRDLIIYYDASSAFRVHFRNPREATAALNILLQGENIELPPYWVEKEE